MKKLGIIYKATGPTGKVYIGQTTYSLEIRKRWHLKDSKRINTHFARAIRKHGWDNFAWEIIHDNCPESDLNTAEIHYIQLLDTYKNGYNSTLGGKGTREHEHGKEFKQKMSEARMGEKNPFYGKCHSPETKQKMSKAKIGEKCYIYGKHHSEETKRKMSKARKGLRPNAKLNWKSVKEIRKKYATGKYTQNLLAKEYKISRSQISNIINNRKWMQY